MGESPENTKKTTALNLPNEKPTTQRARKLRTNQTNPESLLWSVLRGRQLCGLKFRRQHPIGPFFVDFACVSKRLVVAVDGDYHDYVAEKDKQRETYLKQNGWDVLRFLNEDVEEDLEAVARGVAQHLKMDYDFKPRKGGESGSLKKRPK